MQTQITGKYVAAQNPFNNGSFRKQTILVEVVNGTYTSYFPIDFTQGNIDSVFPQIQPNGTFTFTCYVQGSKTPMTDKNGQPTAYLSLSCTAVVPAQPQQVPPPQVNITPPAQTTFGQQQQQQGGFIGFPQQTAQQPVANFGNQPAQAFPQQQQQQGFPQQAPQSFNPNAG